MGLFTRDKKQQQLKEYEKMLKQYQKLKQKWAVEDEKTKKDVITALLVILKDGGIESYEDDACTKPTTKELLELKTCEELINQFEDLLKAVRGQIE